MSDALDLQPINGSVNPFAPTNPQNQTPGTQGTPLSPLMPKNALPSHPPQNPQEQAPLDIQPQQSPQGDSGPAQVINYKPSLDLQPVPTDPDTAAMKDYVNKNVASYMQTQEYKDKNPTQSEAKTFWDALKAGWQNSTLGLAWRDKMPDVAMPKDPSMGMNIVNSISSLAGDLPAMVAGGAFFGGVGAGMGAVEGSVVPIAGTAVGAVTEGTMGAMAGAFAAPKAIRKLLVDHYERGDIQDSSEFAHRLMGATWEAVKGGVTGIATEAGGGLATGTLTKLATEIGIMTTAGSMVEGNLPNAKDFSTAALTMGALHTLPIVTSKLRNIYAETGLHPNEVVDKAQNDPVLYQQLMSRDMSMPPEAQHTELQHFSQAEGTIPSDGEQAKAQGEKPKEDTIPSLENHWSLVPRETEAEKISDDSGEPPKPPVENPPATGGEGGGGDGGEFKPSDNEKEMLNLIGEQKEVKDTRPIHEKVVDTFNESVAYGVDRVSALKTLYDKAGVEMDGTTADQLMKKFSAAGDSVEAFRLHGTRDFKTGEINGEGIDKIFKDYRTEFPNDPRREGLKAYGIAARALEKSEQGKSIEVNGKPIDLDKAMDVATKGQQTYGPYLQRLVEMKNRVLKYQKDAGFYTNSSYKAMVDMNQAHFSLKRVMDQNEFDGTIPSSKSAPVKELFGKGGFLQDPILSTYRDIESMVTSALQNQVKTTLLKDFGMLGEPGIHALEASGKEGIELYKDPEKPENSIYFKEAKGDDAKGGLRSNQFSVFVEGKRRVFETHPIIADAINSMSSQPETLGIMGKVLVGLSQGLRIGIVNNPLFAARHIYKNQLTGAVYSETGLKPFYSAAAALPKFLSESKEYQDALYNRAFVKNVAPIDKMFVEKNVYDIDKKAPFLSQAWNAISPHENISRADNVTRFAEYMNLIDKGQSPEEASSGARNVLPDYQTTAIKKGALWTRATAFLKVHLLSEAQMLGKFADDFNNGDYFHTALKASLWLGVPALLSYASGFRKDEKGEWTRDKDLADQKDYLQYLYDTIPIDHWRKLDMAQQSSPALMSAMSAHDPTSVRRAADGSTEINDKVLLKFPTSFTMGAIFGGGPKAILEAIRKKDPGVIGDWAKSVASAAVPNAIYTAALPGVEMLTNHSFWMNSHLVSSFDEKYLPELEYKPYTSQLAKSLGKIVATMPIISKIGADTATMANPQVIDNWIRAWTGTLGTYAVGLSSQGLKSTPNPEWRLQDTPFFKEFMIRQPSTTTQSMEDFRNDYTKYEQVMSSALRAQKSGNQPEMNYIQSRYNDYLHTQGVDGIHGSIVKMEAFIHNIDNQNMSPIDKRQLMDAAMYQMTDMARFGAQLFKQARKMTQGGH